MIVSNKIKRILSTTSPIEPNTVYVDDILKK